MIKKIFFIGLITLFGFCIYTEINTPEVYITTNVYEGYVTDSYHCSKHSTKFIDSKTNKTIVLDHTSNHYLIGKYKAQTGDHYKVIETITKKTDYHRTYKVYYNGKIISNNDDQIRIYQIY